MSDTRSELKNKMKEDAKRAWQTIKDVFNRYSQYGVVALGLVTGVTLGADESSTQYAKSLSKGNQKLENKLKIKEVKQQSVMMSPLRQEKNAQIDISWSQIMPQTNEVPWQKKSTKEQAEEIYQEKVKDNIVGNISVQDLFDSIGVTKADIQSVVDKDPSILTQMYAGDINKRLEKAADQVRYDGSRGKCTYGVQQSFCKAGIGEELDGNSPNWPEKERGAGGSNSGCNVHIALERGGLFTTVHIENKAYSRRGKAQDKNKENQEMNEFIQRLPGGTTLSIDNKVDEYQGLRLPKDNQGIIHGHTGIINSRHNLACDFEQINGVNFSRYGKQVNISIAKDMKFSPEFGKRCIEAKLDREQRVAQAEKQQKKMAYLGR